MYAFIFTGRFIYANDLDNNVEYQYGNKVLI